MKIIVDGMGGDDAPQVIVDGAVQAAEELPEGVSIVLVGKEHLLMESRRAIKAIRS